MAKIPTKEADIRRQVNTGKRARLQSNTPTIKRRRLEPKLSAPLKGWQTGIRITPRGSGS